MVPTFTSKHLGGKMEQTTDKSNITFFKPFPNVFFYQMADTENPVLCDNTLDIFGEFMTKQNYLPLGQGVQNFWIASQCLLMAGGVKCKKFGIFINSTLAYFPGVDCPFKCAKPCLTGKGTDAGWKVLGPGQTEGQSWSGFMVFSLKKEINLLIKMPLFTNNLNEVKSK